MSKKILIVEDQAISAMSIEENLIDLGYQVSDIVDKGEDVSTFIEKDRPDLILIDVNLKGEMSGIKTTKIINEKYNIPIVYLTDISSDKTFEKAKKTNPFGYLIKPFVPKDLRSTIEMALYKHQMDVDLLKTKKLLKESQRLRKIGSWEHDLVKNKFTCTDEVYRILEVDKSNLEVTYESFLNYIHPEDAPKIDAGYKNSLITKSQYEMEYRVVTNIGEIKYIVGRWDTIFSNNDPLMSYGSIQDITGEVLVRKKIALSEKHFSSLFLNSIHENYLFDIESKTIVDLNDAALKELGYIREELIGETVTKIIPKEFHHLLLSIMDEFNALIPDTTLIGHIRKDGSVYPVEIKYRKVNYYDKSLLLVQVRNTSQRKISEEKLKESEFIYRSLFEQNLSGIYRMSADKKIIDCNTAFANMIGIETREGVVGKFSYDLYETDVDIFDKIANVNGELKLQESLITLKPDKKRKRFLENTHVIKDNEDNIIYYEGSVINTTCLLEIEKEKKIFELLPAENPNPVIRMDYDFKVLYNNKPAEELVEYITEGSYILNEKIVRFAQKIIRKKQNNGRVEIKYGAKTYFLYVYNLVSQNYINIYAVDITELKITAAGYLRLYSDLEELVEKRTKELNYTLTELNKEVNDRHIAENEAKKSLAEKDVLLNEITHRVKNNLQVIASLLSLQKESIKSKETFQILSETGHRIKSMALIHETLYKSNDLNFINIRSYIDSLISYISNSFEIRNINISTKVEEIDLSIDTATSCGMIIMELITNSMKYIFNEGDKGEILLEINKIDKLNFKLTISDNGTGDPDNVDFIKTKTLSMQLVTGITSQLKGSIKRIPSKGTCFEIIFKDTKRHKYV